ncbi:MAG: sulfurase [Solirubrobacterales bacterium]|jgi:MOSC domain-containing protein YiiM|nr:sulfurase [Solirubrobacterales bacterium]
MEIVVERIAIRPTGDGPTVEVSQVVAVPGGGLAGDRYANGEGSFYEPGKTGQDLTIIAAEALEGAGVSVAEAGRNVVVRGLEDLNGLVGRTLALGELEVYVDRLCDPCAVLARRTRPEVLRALAHRGGLRCDVRVGGTLRVGDRLAA